MKRVNAIVHHPVFAARLKRLEELEAERVFCRHDLTHLLDVARLMWIDVLEGQLPLDREVVYAAALLHDIGRTDQIEHGIPHDQAGAELAARILPEAGFSPEEAGQILQAIRGHRADGSEDILGKLLYRSDKASRACWCCGAKGECNWSEEKKNWDLTR